MNWETRIIQESELSSHRRDLHATDLPSQVEALLNHQIAHWPLLSAGVRALSDVSLKKIFLGRFEVFAQFNPQRITSAAAQVDQASIQKRPCFLCDENLPAEEKGLAYGEELIILCNPFPIVNRHLSIVHRSHLEQTIAGRFEMVLDLARDLSREFFVLYNGPQCGASAPDHFHLQAGGREDLPLEKHMALIQEPTELGVHKCEIVRTEGIELFTLDDYHLRVLIYCGSNPEALARWFYRTMEILAELTGNHPEPLMNLIATFDDPNWTVYLFPRAKHRPACYYAEGEDKLLVSPGAMDLAGCLVIPVEADFAKINAEIVREIFSEVTLGPEAFSGLTGKAAGLFW